MLVYDSSLDIQHSTVRKFAERWFGPYIVKKAYNNLIYKLSELDVTLSLRQTYITNSMHGDESL